MKIFEITNPVERSRVARTVLEALTDWFEIPETREGYIRDAADQTCFAALEGESPLGFLCEGIGRQLFDAARARARTMGYRFMQVKTVKMGVYEDYDITNRFYLSLGFQEFECIPELWGPENPCQIYVMALNAGDR